MEPKPGPRAERTAVPDEVRSRAGLRKTDYQDAFTVQVREATRSTAEQWIREVFESPSSPVRSFVRLGWLMFGAELGPSPSPGHVAGWRIGAVEPDCVRLDVNWKIGLCANLVLRTDLSSVVLATFVEHRNRASRLVWPMLLPMHIPILRYLLTRAARVHVVARDQSS